MSEHKRKWTKVGIPTDILSSRSEAVLNNYNDYLNSISAVKKDVNVIPHEMVLSRTQLSQITRTASARSRMLNPPAFFDKNFAASNDLKIQVLDIKAIYDLFKKINSANVQLPYFGIVPTPAQIFIDYLKLESSCGRALPFLSSHFVALFKLALSKLKVDKTKLHYILFQYSTYGSSK